VAMRAAKTSTHGPMSPTDAEPLQRLLLVLHFTHKGTIRELARTSCCGKLRMECISTNEKACSGIQPETLSLLPDRLLERSSGAKERLLAVRK
jgi:hypothetical protein